jgi:DUF177 domain-containing protein
MFLSLQEMERRKLRFEETFSPGEIQFLDRKLRQATPLRAVGSAELLPNTDGEIRVRGQVTVCMEADCDRCLEPASFPIDLAFDLFYAPAASAPPKEEVAVGPGESEVGFYEGDGLELEDVLREQVLLALPMQWICRAECKGICLLCGQNRNLAGCDCQLKPVDDRWAALREL